MKTQVVYETNADYEATYQNLVESKIILADRTKKGLIWFRIKGSRTIFTLSPYGKLQVKWNSLEEKKVVLRIVKNLIVPDEGEKLRIRPTGQQAFIPYPVPQKFKLYWCEEKTEYIKKPANLPTRESVILNFIIVAIGSIFGFLSLHGLRREVSPIVANQTGLEVFFMKIMVEISPLLALSPIIILSSVAILLKFRPSILQKIKTLRF